MCRSHGCDCASRGWRAVERVALGQDFDSFLCLWANPIFCIVLRLELVARRDLRLSVHGLVRLLRETDIRLVGRQGHRLVRAWLVRHGAISMQGGSAT